MKIISSFFLFFRELYQQRRILHTLVLRDFQSRYLATYLGLPWAFIQPAMYVVVIWFAFSYGMRAGVKEDGTPFVPWLMAGLIPWLYVSTTIFSSCNSLVEYAYLIKKTKFNVSFIPLVKIFSGMIVHLILMLLVIILWLIKFEIRPSLHWIQWIYYLFSTVFLLGGIAWFVASIHVFVKDIVHVINILVTIFFWCTPIIWPYTMLNGPLRYFALLNPFFHITEGYRYTFLEQRWFFEFPEMMLYFWIITAGLFVLGTFAFQKLKPDFGDVL